MPHASVAPPQNLDAERRVLGSLLVFYSPPLADKVKATGLKPEDFYYRAHEVVYRATLALRETGAHVDSLTVTGFLRAQPHDRSGSWLEAAGGQAQVEYLALFADANGVVECARMLAQDGRWRRWLDAMYGGIEAAHRRDEQRFWSCMARVREDVLPGELHVVRGEGQAA